MRHSNTKFTPEQLELLGKVLYQIQQLFNTFNGQTLEKTFGSSAQRFQYHANKNKTQKGGSK